MNPFKIFEKFKDC